MHGCMKLHSESKCFFPFSLFPHLLMSSRTLIDSLDVDYFVRSAPTMPPECWILQNLFRVSVHHLPRHDVSTPVFPETHTITGVISSPHGQAQNRHEKQNTGQIMREACKHTTGTLLVSGYPQLQLDSDVAADSYCHDSTCGQYAERLETDE